MIYFEDEIPFTLNTDPCKCEHSPFNETHNKHIITSDLRIVGDSKFWKLLAKDPNNREPRSTYFNKPFAEITTGLDNCIENLASKN